MVYVLVQFHLSEFEKFWSLFTSNGKEIRKEYGSRFAQVFRNSNAPNEVSVLFEWESEEKVRQFMADDRVKANIRAGTILAAPQVTFLQEVAKLEA